MRGGRAFGGAAALLAVWLALGWGAGGAAAQGVIVLDAQDAFQPEITTCSNPTIFNADNLTVNSTDCTPRSAGCNLDTQECVLSPTLGYLNPVFMVFSLRAYSETSPGATDGWLEANITYAQPSIFPVRGFAQAWRLVGTAPGEETYAFSGIQEYIGPALPSEVPRVFFRALTAGDYRVVYWDVGGTRYGNGVPEFSDRITVGRVFDAPPNCWLKPVPQPAPEDPPYGYNPVKVVKYTLLTSNNVVYMSYQLQCDGPFVSLLLTANTTLHNRVGFFEYRTNQGNVLNAKGWVDDDDDGLMFEIVVLPNGGLNDTVNNIQRSGLATLLQYRLLYVGSDISTFRNMYENRQMYGEGTLLARRIIHQTEVAIVAQDGQSPDNIPHMNYLDVDAGGVEGTDHLYTFFSYWARVKAQLHSSGTPTYVWGGALAWEGARGRLGTAEDWVNDLELGGGGAGTQEGNIAGWDIYYAPHDNVFTATNDYSCFVTGSLYANSKDVGGTIPSPYPVPPGGSTIAGGTLWDKYTFSDIVFGSTLWKQWIRPDVGGSCGTVPVSQCYLTYEATPSDFYRCCQCNVLGFQGQYCEGGSGTFLLQAGAAPVCAPWIMWGYANQIGSTDIPNPEELCGDKLDPSFPVRQLCIKGCSVGGFNDPSSQTHYLYNASATDLPYFQMTRYFSQISALTSQDVARPTFLVPPRGLGIPLGAPPVADRPYSFNTLNPDGDANGNPTYVSKNHPSNNRHRFGTLGLDVQSTVYNFQQIQGGNLRRRGAWIFPGYARFKVYPQVTFHSFYAAQSADSFGPARIELGFEVSCPLLELGINKGATPAYCAEVWTLTNQFGDPLVLRVVKGTYNNISVPYTFGPTQTLGPVQERGYWRVQIKYNDGDIVQWLFRLRVEPEANPVSAYCQYIAYEKPVPPKQYVLPSLKLSVTVAAPACEYTPPEVIARPTQGEPEVFGVVVGEDLPAYSQLGIPVDYGRSTHYYFTWESGSPTKKVQGYSQQVQLYDPPMKVTVCDRKVCRTMLGTDFNFTTVDPTFPNPLLRAPNCYQTTAISNVVCPVAFDAPPTYSGINQYPVCFPATQERYTILTPLFVFVPPYSLINNVRAYFFNFTTEFTDIYIDALRNAGYDVQENAYVATRTGAYTLQVNYGRYIPTSPDEITAPCWERLQAQVNILTPFEVDPQPLQRIAGCTRADDCCYFKPFVVYGSSPTNAQVVNLATDPSCVGVPECSYEVVVAPVPPAGAGLCLGADYVFTVRNPPALVANRTYPAAGLPYRCEQSYPINIPATGLSMLSILQIPGTCTAPGTQLEVSFTVTDPLCQGPVTAANGDAACALRLFFAINGTAVGGGGYPGGPTLSSPWEILPPYATTYNIPATLSFPHDFNSALAPLPNGHWTVHMWLRPPAPADPSLAATTDARFRRSSDVAASMAQAEGLTIVRTALVRPQCGAVNTPILITFEVRDAAYEGPYNLTLVTPLGAVIANRTVDQFDLGCGCDLLSPTTPCPDCNRIMRSTGIVWTAGIGTGPQAPGGSGGFSLLVFANLSRCPAVYTEFMDELRTLNVQIACFPTTCAGGQNGAARTSVTGGTPIPFLNQGIVTSSYKVDYEPWYYYAWDSPRGVVLGPPNIEGASQGRYRVNVTDWAGCNATAQCAVNASAGDFQLVPVSTVPPNCSGQFGTATFRVVGNAVPPLTLMKISANQIVHVGNTYTLVDTTVVPGVNSTYVVVDGGGCMSPEVSFAVAGPQDFYLILTVVAQPCGDNSLTGEATASVPPGLGTVVTWVYLNTGATVLVGTHLTNAPAGSYRVTATSSLYGCETSKILDLSSSGGPLVGLYRAADPAAVALDIAQITMTSSNGPPWTYTLYFGTVGLPPAQQPVVTASLLAPTGSIVITNLPTQTTFQAIIRDSAHCPRNLTSIGHIIPETVQIQSPSPIPGTVSIPQSVLQRETVVPLVLAVTCAFAYYLFWWLGDRTAQR